MFSKKVRQALEILERVREERRKDVVPPRTLGEELARQARAQQRYELLKMAASSLYPDLPVEQAIFRAERRAKKREAIKKGRARKGGPGSGSPLPRS